MPFEAPVRWATGVQKGITKTIVQVYTDEGIVGLGEAPGEGTKLAIDNSIKPAVIGQNPFEIERLLRTNMSGFGIWDGQIDLTPFSGVEFALWDIMGKAVGKPVCELIGGMYRDKVPFAAYIFPRYTGEGGVGGESTPESIAKYCVDMIDKYGVTTLECKLGVFPSKQEVEQIRAIREAVGEEVQIRVDPNRTWSTQTAVQTIRAMEKYNLRNVEEPCRGLEAAARVKRAIHTPTSTHSPLLLEVCKLGVADAITGVPYWYGGIWMTKKFAATAEILNLGFWLESSGELGIHKAVHLHIAASTPHMIDPNQTHANHLVDDIIVGGKFKFEKGYMTVPKRAGLGVELDQDKLKKYAELYKKVGGYPSTFDDKRPSWQPLMPGW